MRHVWPLLAFAASLVAASAQAATRDDFLYGNSEPDGTGLPFRYFVPPDATPGEAYPVILFLHGSGERGSDNEAQLNNSANGAMQLLDDANLALQPVFMIAPQCPTDGWWSGGTLATAIGLVDQLAEDHPIDMERVYITGLSMGGMGTSAMPTTSGPPKRSMTMAFMIPPFRMVLRNYPAPSCVRPCRRKSRVCRRRYPRPSHNRTSGETRGRRS